MQPALGKVRFHAARKSRLEGEDPCPFSSATGCRPDAVGGERGREERDRRLPAKGKVAAARAPRKASQSVSCPHAPVLSVSFPEALPSPASLDASSRQISACRQASLGVARASLQFIGCLSHRSLTFIVLGSDAPEWNLRKRITLPVLSLALTFEKYSRY